MAKKKSANRRNRHNTMYYNLGGVTHSSTFMPMDNALQEKIEQQKVSVDTIMNEANMKYLENGCNGFVITLKNGNAFLDGGINIPTKDGKINNYMAYPVYMRDDKVYDERNGYEEMDCYEYLDILAKKNPKLRMDCTMSHGIPWNEKFANKLNQLSVRR